jgi:hypothetical protein
MNNQTSGVNEEFKVTHYNLPKGKEITNKVIIFRSDIFKEFSNKSFKDYFEQIRRYYHTINYMLRDKFDYPNLKFISDPRITSYNQNNVNKKHILDNIDWHLKLRVLSLRGLDKNSLSKLFQSLYLNDIRLQSLTLEASNTNNTFSQIEIEPNNVHIKHYFKKASSVTDFHLVNFKITDIKVILDYLRLKFDTVKNLSEDEDYELPFKNLSFKKPNNSNVSCTIDLNELFLFFNEMSNLGSMERLKSPFDCLDLSGCDCINLESLLGVMNNFKLIRKISLSKTKFTDKLASTKDKFIENIHPSCYLINNPNFLPYIIPSIGEDHIRGFTMETGIGPLLETLYIYDTPIVYETFTELINLFKVHIINLETKMFYYYLSLLSQ